MNVFDGKYGAYVKWEKINATIPDTIEVADLTLDQAVTLIEERAAKSAKKVTRKAPAKKKAAAKKPAAKKAAAKKKPAAKKAPAKKA